MSDQPNSGAKKPAAPERPTVGPPVRRGPGSGGGPFGGMGMPAEKSMTFLPSAKRLLRRLLPHRVKVVFVVLLGVVSVVFAVLGPKLLGEGTNIIFEGAISKSLPPGATKEQIIDRPARRRATISARISCSGMNLHPGQGIDFGALQRVLLLVLALYVLVQHLHVAAGARAQPRRAGHRVRACGRRSRTRSTACR